jgi:hypothetical protein
MPSAVSDSVPDVVTAAEPPAVVELSCSGPVVVAMTDEPPHPLTPAAAPAVDRTTGPADVAISDVPE